MFRHRLPDLPVALLAVALAVVPACSKKPAQAPEGAGGAPATAAPTPRATVSALDPIAKPEKLQSGVSLTTFPNNQFTGPGEVKTIVSALDFDCGKNQYNEKEVSLRYEGYLELEKDGAYVFQIMSDDQSSLYLNGKLALDQLDSTQTQEKLVQLKAGVYSLRLDYQNNVGPACLRVRWSGDNRQTFVPIPATRLLH